VKLFTLDPSVMFARVATDAVGVTESVAALVAVRATVAVLDVVPIWAEALPAPIRSTAVAPSRAFLNGERMCSTPG